MPDRTGWTKEPVDRSEWTKVPAEDADASKPIDWDKEAEAFKEGTVGNFKAAADTASLGLFPRALATVDALKNTRGAAAGSALIDTLNGRGGFSDNYRDEKKDLTPTDFSDDYNKALTKRQADSRETAYLHPSAAITGGFMIPPIGKGLSLAQRLVAAGVTGAAAGNLEAPHDDYKARGEGSVTGGLTGLAMQGTSEAFPAFAAKFGPKIREAAQLKALNVPGGSKGQLNDRLRKMGIEPEDHAEVGQSFLDEGLIPWGLGWKDPAEVVLSRAQKLKKDQSANIATELSAADQRGEFDPIRASDEINDRLTPDNPLEADNQKKARAFSEQVARLAPQGEYAAPDSFAQANKMKSEAWDAANFLDDAKLEPAQYRKAVAQLRDSIRNQVGEIDQGSANRLTDANRRYGTAADAEKLAKNAVSRSEQGSQFGLPAAAVTLLGGAGLGHGGPIEGTAGALAGLAGSHFLKSRGPTFAARAGGPVASTLEGLGGLSKFYGGAPLSSGANGSALDRFLRDAPVEEKARLLKELEERLASQSAESGMTTGAAQAFRQKFGPR